MTPDMVLRSALMNEPARAQDKRTLSRGGRRAVANDEHLALLRQGTAIWNEWRARNSDVQPDLREADLRSAKFGRTTAQGAANLRRADLAGACLREADLNQANFSGANLAEANLSRADLDRANLSGANLFMADISGANLAAADLHTANLPKSNLKDANLIAANLRIANLSGADLRDANFFRASLIQADLCEANLHGTNFTGANLTDLIVSRARLSQTVFGGTNLQHVIGLGECAHLGPSVIDFRTLSRSGNLPLSFLRGCGLSDTLIEYLPALRGEAIQFYSCFISYSAKDQAFAERLHADLQNKGVRCWFAPHDLPWGAKTWDTIDEAIRLRDKLLLILSKGSIASEWVEDEVNRAYGEERSRKEVVLFPVRIDNAVIATAEPWAVKLRERNIGDFRQWKKPAEYQKSLDRLLRDLKARGAK
jgi:uncharacterized protein YjbI with pentapeptide repeats